MQQVRERLFAMQDKAYGDFHAGLVPNIPRESIIGVRMPKLRAYAREFVKDPALPAFFAALPHQYYEENTLHGVLIGMFSKDITAVFAALDAFLPYVDNWATCDSMSPKIFARYPEAVYEKALGWLQSDHPYTQRFAIDVLMDYFLDAQFRPAILDRLAAVRSEEYYVNMALAWYFSFALIKQYEAALPLLTQKRLDPWVHNKSIQKAVESYRIDDATKAYLRTLRIKPAR